ncbi:uncharacterized protein LAESUDRAFT_724615 [Laetiporus sulphureus 93-53]|uniref:G-patch domain-containing protein n=1 Tax=Laetiporus sulphureus 93-53 TaxID=1314785 RepID=A0A165ERW0_9APHY|nr:uncharacterized protein LAESUDRAFT_724615 [Laetiporus sulphureus 93-53]KZT07640.1 hypothetical protein LAESUDRAFT_724615 [Laetiporus sulphureus 93-53]
MLQESELQLQVSSAIAISSQAGYRHSGDNRRQTRPPDSSGAVYSPEVEWPGTEGSNIASSRTLYSEADMLMRNEVDEPSACSSVLGPSRARSSEITSLRLVVQRSSVLSKKLKVAITDGYSEVQIGRDVAPVGSDVPRIRLKEMEVSKLHDTVYWDQQRSEWAVVDMGSKHGTFLKSNRGIRSSPGVSDSGVPSSSQGPSESSREDPRGMRLSPSRVASIPRRLTHLDLLSIGDTTFIVHIHDSQMPCIECSPTGDDEIPLFDSRRADREQASSTKRKREETSGDNALAPPATGPVQQDAKKALSMLRRSLLSRRDGSLASAKGEAPQYVDRSARRRALYPQTPPDPGRARAAMSTSSLVQLPDRSVTASPVAPVSAPPTPLPETNIGHRLLLKQGWEPGMSLGQESTDLALKQPLEVSVNTGRLGLGATASTSVVGPNTKWKENAKHRRWDSLRSDDSPGKHL